MTERPEVIDVGGPRCSWCWGMAPVVEYPRQRRDVDLRIIVGGLGPGPSAQPLKDESRNEAWNDFAPARELGVEGFPTVLLRTNGKVHVLSPGYASIDYLESSPAHWVGAFRRQVQMRLALPMLRGIETKAGNSF